MEKSIKSIYLKKNSACRILRLRRVALATSSFPPQCVYVSLRSVHNKRHWRFAPSRSVLLQRERSFLCNKKSVHLILKNENLSIKYTDFFILGKLAPKTKKNQAAFAKMGIKSKENFILILFAARHTFPERFPQYGSQTTCRQLPSGLQAIFNFAFNFCFSFSN